MGHHPRLDCIDVRPNVVGDHALGSLVVTSLVNRLGKHYDVPPGQRRTDVPPAGREVLPDRVAIAISDDLIVASEPLDVFNEFLAEVERCSIPLEIRSYLLGVLEPCPELLVYRQHPIHVAEDRFNRAHGRTPPAVLTVTLTA